MKNLFYFLSLVITLNGYCLNKVVDINNPISDIDISYTNEDKLVRLIVILNTIQSDQNNASEDDEKSTKYPIEVSIKGLVHWNGNQTKTNKHVLKNISLKPLNRSKPHVLFADLYDESNSPLKQPSIKNDWKKISLQLQYKIAGKIGHTPTINLYPPKKKSKTPTESININTSAVQKGTNRGIITIKSNNGTPFKVEEIIVTKVSGNNQTTLTLSGENIKSNRFGSNGRLDLEFNSPFPIEHINSKYFVSCTATLIGSTNSNFSVEKTEVIFLQDYDLEILNRGKNFNINIPIGNDRFVDNNIRTRGHGNLGIRFLNPEYQKIKPSVSKSKEENTYEITLDGWEGIQSETSSIFYYTDGEKDISPPLTISKQLPKVKNFKFNGIKNDSITISFELAQSAGSTISPSISFSTPKGIIDIKGKTFLRENLSSDQYSVTISQNIPLLGNEEIVKDISLNVNYDKNILYNLTVTVFNQRYYNQSMDSLRMETSKKKSLRDNEKIKQLVEKIVAFGKAVGNSVEIEEVNLAINQLQNFKGEKLKAVLADIGKWAIIVGKIILPFLA